MKNFSVLITDTLEGGRLYLIENDNEKAFYAQVCAWHEGGRSDLGEEGEEREKITDEEVEILQLRLKRGKHTQPSHGITRYEYRFITFHGELVAD